MSGVKDPFEILADEITLIRRQMDHLQRTSLDKDEAEAFNATIAKFLAQLGKTAPAMQEAMRRDLAYVGHDVRKHAVEAAQSAAKEAIEKSHAEKPQGGERPLTGRRRGPQRGVALVRRVLGMVSLDRGHRGASGRVGGPLDHRQRRCPRVRPVSSRLLRIGRRSGR
ncbi:hypothetical protein [uncultured Paracoccus sp.]|uniref:hypothetical protein n=1 Tax=uncultured Paracoccus sp. TaxID=189685 RepID=UPI0026273D31|nr:hypothetical protein [uncultured Paracoccus sp.]